MEIYIKARLSDESGSWEETFNVEFGFLPEYEDVEKHLYKMIDTFNASCRETESPRKLEEIITWHKVEDASDVKIGCRTMKEVEDIRISLTTLEEQDNDYAIGAKAILRWLIEGDDDALNEIAEFG